MSNPNKDAELASAKEQYDREVYGLNVMSFQEWLNETYAFEDWHANESNKVI